MTATLNFMSEVTVKANQPVFGLPDGAVVTVERTERVDGAINAGILTVVGDVAPEPLGEPIDEPDKLADTSDDVEPTKSRTQRGKSRG